MLISKFGAENILEKIEIYEDRANIKLPKQLRNFIEKYNGGETPNTKFNYNGVSSDVKVFYGLGKVEYSFDSVNAIGDSRNRYLPFALDSFGNELMINLDSGAILFMNHENGNLQRLTDDFNGFINICVSGSVITDALRAMWKAEIDKYTSFKPEEVHL